MREGKAALQYHGERMVLGISRPEVLRLIYGMQCAQRPVEASLIGAAISSYGGETLK